MTNLIIFLFFLAIVCIHAYDLHLKRKAEKNKKQESEPKKTEPETVDEYTEQLKIYNELSRQKSEIFTKTNDIFTKSIEEWISLEEATKIYFDRQDLVMYSEPSDVVMMGYFIQTENGKYKCKCCITDKDIEVPITHIKFPFKPKKPQFVPIKAVMD